MFNPDDWTSQTFTDAVLITTGQRRIINLVVPAEIVIGITALYFFNADSSDHDVNLELTGPGASLEAPIFRKKIMSSFADMLIPHEPDVLQEANFPTPLILNGPIIFTVKDTFPLTAPSATMIITVNWLQAPFAAQSSAPILPIGSTV